MKRNALIILSIMLTIFCCGCSSTEAAVPQETTVEATTAETEAATAATAPVEIEVMDPVPAVDFVSLLPEVSAGHKAMVESDSSLDSINQYLVVDPETVDLLTTEEIQDLLSHGPYPHSLTYGEATADVDILFRTFRNAYGAYYYFGEEAFQNAQAEIMAWLEGKEVVNTNAFETALSGVFSFLRDAHSSVGHRVYEEDLRYEYFYTDQAYARDDDGYYLYLNNEKWYLESFTDSRVTMEPTLTVQGRIVYSPVLFCRTADMGSCDVVLKNTPGETKTKPITWQLSSAYGNAYRTPDFHLLEENGIAYLSVRCFDNEYKHGELAQFVASGKEVRDAKLIIFDIRSNGGGTDSYCRDWVKNFCGTTPQYTLAHTTRISKLRNTYLQNDGFHKDPGKLGTYKQNTVRGKQVKNQIPIIVLVDDTCGSSGESMLNLLRCLDNVIIVGSNSGGYQMCGNQSALWLPHSNIPFAFGSSLQFTFTEENWDFKGYAPDIWCDPVNALSSVLNMLQHYELADEATLEVLRDGTQFQQIGAVTVHWQGFEIHPGNMFGSIQQSGKDYIQICNNGTPITDFTIRSENPELLGVELAPDGQVYLIHQKSFEGNRVPFTITYQGCDFTYYCADHTWVP